MTTDIVLTTPDLSGFWTCFKNDGGFDASGFRQLCEDTNEETVLRILARLVESLNEAADQIVAASRARDCETVWRYCHKVAGSAELIGFSGYSEVAREINSQIRANPDYTLHLNDINDFTIRTRKLAGQISGSCPNLKQYL